MLFSSKRYEEIYSKVFIRVNRVSHSLEKKLQEIWNTQYHNSIGSINLPTLRVPFAIYDFYFASQLKNIVGVCRSFDKFSSISFNEFIIYIALTNDRKFRSICAVNWPINFQFLEWMSLNTVELRHSDHSFFLIDNVRFNKTSSIFRYLAIKRKSLSRLLIHYTM